MEDLQGLLEKINREGVEKAEAEAKRIVAEAEAKAAAIVQKAQAAAAKAKADADEASVAFAARASVTIRQAARDVVQGVRDSVEALLTTLLTKDVEAALANEQAVAELVFKAIEELVGPGEVVCAPQLAATLKAQAARLGNFEVAADSASGAGFSVRLEQGRVEQTFTAEAIAAELARRLRPDLAELVK